MDPLTITSPTHPVLEWLADLRIAAYGSNRGDLVKVHHLLLQELQTVEAGLNCLSGAIRQFYETRGDGYATAAPADVSDPPQSLPEGLGLALHHAGAKWETPGSNWLTRPAKAIFLDIQQLGVITFLPEYVNMRHTHGYDKSDDRLARRIQATCLLLGFALNLVECLTLKSLTAPITPDNAMIGPLASWRTGITDARAGNRRVYETLARGMFPGQLSNF